MGPALDALDDTGIAQLSLSISKVLRKKHRAPFALKLRHPLRLFVQAYDAVVFASDAGSPSPALALNLERATKLLYVTPALLRSSGGCCNR